MKKQFLALAMAAAGLFGAAQQATAEPLAVLSTQTGATPTQQIATIDDANPGVFLTNTTITGLVAGDRLIGIDRRPANGLIYGIGLNGTTARLYTINATTGVATPGAVLTNIMGGATLAVTGTNFGFDFNPVPDRLRLVSNTDINLRINVDNGQTNVDGNLAYAAGDPNAGQNPNITTAAYSNNFAGAPNTTLRDTDASLDILAIQNPPNDGTLNTSLSLGSVVTDIGAYDISGLTGTAYFVFVDAGGMFSNLYRGGMGGLTLVGRIGAVNGFIVDGLAAPIGTIPEPATMILLGTGLAGVAARVRRRRQAKS